MHILDLMDAGIHIQMLPNEVDDTVTMRFTKDGVGCDRVFDRIDIVEFNGGLSSFQTALCEGVMDELNMPRE